MCLIIKNRNQNVFLWEIDCRLPAQDSYLMCLMLTNDRYIGQFGNLPNLAVKSNRKNLNCIIYHVFEHWEKTHQPT